MPRVVEPDDKKINITLRIKKRNVDKLKQTKDYNSLVDSLIEGYFSKLEKEKGK